MVAETDIVGPAIIDDSEQSESRGTARTGARVARVTKATGSRRIMVDMQVRVLETRLRWGDVER